MKIILMNCGGLQPISLAKFNSDKCRTRPECFPKLMLCEVPCQETPHTTASALDYWCSQIEEIRNPITLEKIQCYRDIAPWQPLENLKQKTLTIHCIFLLKIKWKYSLLSVSLRQETINGAHLQKLKPIITRLSGALKCLQSLCFKL